jgi:hypothetical protein
LGQKKEKGRGTGPEKKGVGRRVREEAGQTEIKGSRIRGEAFGVFLFSFYLKPLNSNSFPF